ncbi:unnamed protein product, partial [Candidula unifasciata]
MKDDWPFKWSQLVMLCLTVLTGSDVIVSTHAQVGPFPFQNTSLPWSQRVDDLVSRLTLDEIQLQMTKGGGGAPAIPRLGIQQFDWTTECLHGAADYNGNATAFPQSIGLAAAFSPDLLYRVATAIGVEVRGKHNDYVKNGQFFSHTGATCFSPVINIARDPRWGRNQILFLTGVLAQQFVWGLQGNHSRFVQATAGCKHFDAYAGPENIPVSRFTFDAQVSDVDWHTTFLPAFKKCVQAGTFSLMCSYNSINGVPACANKELLTDILRDDWNFTGYVVGDEGAVQNVLQRFHYVNSSADAAAACVNAGTNLELPDPSEPTIFTSIVDAVSQGKLTEALVRERVKPLFYTRMRLGEFDPPDENPYASLDSSVVESPEHQALAVEAAIKSFVLLKNLNNALPLNPALYTHVVIVGPMADDVSQIFGDYSAQQDRGFTKTPLQGLATVFLGIAFGAACLDGPPCKSYQPQTVKNLVTGADLIFVALGTGTVIESEGRDRPDVNLPGNQSNVLTDTLNYNDNATIIVLLFSAGPLNVTVFDESPRVAAIIECFFPAQATGDAIAAVIVNKGGNSCPAGRVPITWPKFDWQIPPMVNYSMVGRTYRYLDSDPLYPFGYGLSYSHFTYTQLTVSYTRLPRHNISVTVSVANKGPYDADEVLQCYIQWQNRSLPVPHIQLVYFNRILIQTQTEITHTFDVAWESWSYWNSGAWAVQTGSIRLFCGGQQPFQAKAVPSNVRSVEFEVFGDDSPGVYRPET